VVPLFNQLGADVLNGASARFSGPRTLAKTSRHSRAAKARWADPVIGDKMRTALRDPVSRAKVSETSKARWDDPEKRAQMIAAMRLAGERRRRGKTGDA
jgi:hypothetical protein